MMGNLNKSKKIYSFLLTMIMVISLFFFAGCDLGDEKLTIKIIYRPYSTSRQNLLTKTYGELIKENLLEVSNDVLTRLVGEYGIGDISVKDGNGTQTVYPSIESVDYGTLLDISRNLSDFEQKTFAEDFSSVTNVYFSQSDYILAVANYPISVGDISSIISYSESKYLSQINNLQLLSGTGGYFNYNEEMDTNSAYFYGAGNDFMYIFVGGSVGSSALANFTSVLNASTYISALTATNYNSIQRFVISPNVQNGVGTDIEASSWKYSLSESDFSSISTSQEYLEKYLEKYSTSFAVELSKVILTRYEGCELSNDLKNLYDLASPLNASENNKEKFIDECCKYIDHYGLMEAEKEALLNAIENNIIGEEIISISQDCKEKFDTYISALIDKSIENYVCLPLLEYKSYIAGNLDEIKIDGYVETIVFIASENDFEFSDFLMEFESDDEILKENFNFTLNYKTNGILEQYPFDVDNDDFEDGIFNSSVSDIVDDKSRLTMKKGNDPLSKLIDLNGIAYLVKEDDKEYFCHSQENTNTEGFAWTFNVNIDCVQIVFGKKNLCSNIHFDIIFALL